MAFFFVVLLLPSAYGLFRTASAGMILDQRNQGIEITPPVSTIVVESLPSATSAPNASDSSFTALSATSPGSTSRPQLATTSSSSLSVVSGFEGLNEVQSCTCVPPDVQVAVGQRNVVEMVNLEGEIFNKLGVSNKTFALSSFFSTGSDSISDPKILFDASSSRWFSSLLDITIRNVVIAVSNTSDPTGNWTIYRLSAGTFIPDQPIIGLSDDKFVAGANDFRTSGSFVGAKYWVLNKAQMLAGLAVSTFSSSVNSGFFSIHPVQSLSATTTQYMVANIISSGAFSTSSMEFFSVTGVPGVSTVVTSTTALSVSSLTMPPAGAEPGTSSTIDTSDIRVQDALWNQGKLWYSLDDGCTPMGDTQLRSCIRITQVDTTSSPPIIRQDFDYGVSGLYFFYPAMREDGFGNLDLIYGFSSTTSFPGLASIGQANSDPAGTLGPAQILKAGAVVDTSTRYGDYFGAALDPASPSTVWVAGEYHSSAGGVCGSFGSCWSTFIGSVTIGVNNPSAGGRWAR